MLKMLQELWKDEEGPTAVEYALMLVLVALAIALAAPNIKTAVLDVFSDTATELNKRS